MNRDTLRPGTLPPLPLLAAGLALALALSACAPLPPAVPAAPPAATAATPAAASAPALRLIGSAAIPPGTEVLGTSFGGISGIDYDPASGRWLLISDDRSALQPARIYTATLRYGPEGLDMPAITGVVTLRHANGRPYPSSRRPEPGVDVPDAEAVRWLPGSGGTRFLWTSEGDFGRGFGPQLRESAIDGSAVRDLPLPAGFQPDAAHGRGPRSNGTLEGLALAPDGRTLWLSMEMPWRQDGALPTPAAPGGPVRFTALDLATGRPLRQFAYQPDAVAHARRIPWGPQMNGISEILEDGPHHLLVLERSYSAGAGFSVRLYRIDTRSGSDTLALPALVPGSYTPAPKTLVADLGALGAGAIDNLEGMAWGPPLPGGGRVIVFVSDDNFNPAETTQFIAAEYVAPPAAP